MDSPRIATVECPVCGETVEIVIDSETMVENIGRRECPGGHEFWIRVAEGRAEVFDEPPPGLP